MLKIGWTDIAVAIAALYGAILSTYNFIIKLKEKRSKVKVKLNIGLIGYTDGHVEGPKLTVSAHNFTKKEVILNVPYIVLPNKMKVTLINAESNISLPYELKPGHDCKVWTDLKKLVMELKNNQGFSGIIKIHAIYPDTLENKYKSKKMKLDLDEWSKS